MSDFIAYTKFGTPLRVTPNLGTDAFRVSPTFGITKVISEGGSSILVDELLGLPEQLPDGVVFPSDTEIYRDLEDIMTSMDFELSTAQADEITSQAEMYCGKDTSTGETHPLGKGSSIEQFYGVVAPTDCEFMQEQEVYDFLEQVMQHFDQELTAEMAQTITTNTQQ